MKLTTKLTFLCAVLLLVTTALLSGMMLWQVWEQSYETLYARSAEQLNNLITDYSKAIHTNNSALHTAESETVFLQYHFRTSQLPGSALAREGVLLFAANSVDPTVYLSVTSGSGVQSVRCSINGIPYLIVGKTFLWKDAELQIYLSADASAIRSQLAELLIRFAGLALCVYAAGLLCIHWLIRRTLLPLKQLGHTAERIAAGNYKDRIALSQKDEIGNLAANFDTMAAAVENHVQALLEQNEKQNLFIGGVTHEFKTPLTSLLLNVDTLRSVYLPEEKQQELLETMDSQLHWLEQMVHKLLRLLSMHHSARIVPVSVPEVLEQVQKITVQTMRKYETTLSASCTTDILPMDRDLICSALVNLIENSAKASRPNQTVFLRVYGCTIEVSDTGCGIPKEAIDKVTEPFYMGDPSRSKKSGGFGLGLALVKEIAAVHHAKLEIDSEIGIGTVIRIIFPYDGNQTVIQP